MLAVSALAAVTVLGAAAAPLHASAPADLLDVVQLAGPTGLSSAGTATSIVPVAWNGTNATVGSTFADATAHGLVESGSASSDSQLSLSTNGNYLALGGYEAAVGTSKVGSAAVPRIIARIDAAGNVDTSTTFSNGFATSNFRGVATQDGTQYWGAGDGSNASGTLKSVGIVNIAQGGTSASPVESATKQSVDVAVSSGGAIFFTQQAGSASKGVWETAGGTTSFLTGTAEADPYGLVVLHTGPTGSAPDTIYVTDANGADNGTSPAGGIYKYSFNGTSWVADGSVLGPSLAGLAGRVEPDGSVQLYATTLDGGTGGNQLVTLTDSSGFGNMMTGSFTTVATAALGTVYKGIAFAPTGQQLPVAAPTVTLNQTAASRAIGEIGAPDSFTVTVGDSVFSPDQLTVTASHAAHGTAADPVTGLTVTGSGATRTVTISSADTVGLSDITVTVKTPDGRQASTVTPFEYGVSAAAPDATSSWLENFSNASTAQDAGGGYFIVGDDALNQLALYKAGVSGPPVTTWNFDPQMGVSDTSQIDMEAAARSGNTIYWFGSEGNNSSGEVKANRAIVFATTISGSGASTQLSFAGFYPNLRNDLIAWDEANGNRFGFAAGAADGQIPKEANGFNIEGAEFAAGGSETLYLGFRAPIVPTSNRTQALVVPVTNLPALVAGSASAASFGTPFQWQLTPAGYTNPNGDVSALGIREIRKNAHDQYLIIAGSYEEVPASPNGGAEFLYTWDGNPADQPVLTSTVLPTPDAGSWEGIVATPDPLVAGSKVTLISDDGDNDFYGDGSEAKDLDPGLQRDRSDVFTIAFTLSPSGTTICNGAFGGAGQDIVVPRGAVCDLIPGTTISHDLTVQQGGTLDAEGITVGHDVSANGAAAVTICGSSVSHDAQVQNSSGPVLVGDTGNGCSAGNQVVHDLTVQGSTGAVVVGDSTVGHNLTVQNNHPGGATVERNHAGQDATCHNNAPQFGAGNSAVHALSCPA